VPHDIQAARRHTRPGPREGRVLMADPGAQTGTRLADQPASSPAMQTTVAEAARSPAAGRTGRADSGGPTKV
jgi:hypothetical protein